VSLERQLKEERIAKNQAEKVQEELGASWMQTNAKFETLRTNFDDCQEKADLFSKVQTELESRNEQFELLYKIHMMFEGELAKARTRGNVVNNSQIEEINLIKRKLDKAKIKIKQLEEKNGLLEHHDQMIDTNNH
jgi:predicted transcriptional regulator